MKTLIKLIFFFVLIVVIFIGYRLWEKGDLNKEGLSKHIETVKEKGIQDSLNDLGNEIISLSESAQQKWNEINWNDLRKNIKMDDKDLDEYKKSLKWLYQEDAKINKETPTQKTITVSTNEPKITSEPPIKSEPIEKKKPVKKIGEVKKKKPIAEPEDTGSKYYHEGIIILEKAKAEGRLGIPGKKNFKSHLKKSVVLYKSVLDKFKKAKRDSKCTAKQKSKIEKLESQVASQIYWGKKLGGVH